MAAFQYEPVPRYAKRPGDTVLQGSNNTLICLGTDRGWRWYEQLADESSNVFPPVEQMYGDSAGGTIDLVTGRGRYPEVATTQEAFGTSPTSTAPRLIMNQRAQVEVDKYPESNAFDVEGPRNRNPPGAVGAELEGDPDFLSDQSQGRKPGLEPGAGSSRATAGIQSSRRPARSTAGLVRFLRS